MDEIVSEGLSSEELFTELDNCLYQTWEITVEQKERHFYTIHSQFYPPME